MKSGGERFGSPLLVCEDVALTVQFPSKAVVRAARGPFQMGFRNFLVMKPEDKAEFGQLYLDIVANKAQVDAAYQEAAEAEAKAEAPNTGMSIS